jgi:alkylation response protein AidB-like acyl-CoA dehydrogenase
MDSANRSFEETGGEELAIFRRAVARFVAEEVTPSFDAWREAALTPRSFYATAGRHGLLCPTVPEAFGGAGADFRYNAVVIEEMARSGMCAAGLSVHSDILPGYFLHAGTEAQKRRWLPAMVSGEVLGAIAMSEPGAGSDLAGVRTSARRDGDDYVLNGQKTFISNGQTCDMAVVVAKTDPALGARGVSLFIVDARRPGFNRGRKLKKMGLHEQDTSEIFLEDVRVPADCLLGEENGGFAILMQQLPTERLTIALGAVAAAETAFGLTLDYAKTRTAFGQPVISFQASAFRLAELRTQLRVARVYADDCLRRYLRGEFTAVEGAEAKLFTTGLQNRVVDDCLQMFGGYGFMDEYPLSRMYADARVQRIYGGTDEIMKLIIARTL